MTPHNPNVPLVGFARQPHLYDTCVCGAMKQKASKTCIPCRNKARGYVRPVLEQPSDLSYRLIALTQGKVALVDATDYEWLTQWKWCARKSRDDNGQCKDDYYALRNSELVDGKRHIIFMHRVILGLAHGDPIEGDHALHDTLDNRRFVDGKENLREATDSEQSKNHRRVWNSSTGFKGVSFHAKSGTWRARITVDKKQIFLGLFKTKEEAHAAYCVAAELHHGRFSCVA